MINPMQDLDSQMQMLDNYKKRLQALKEGRHNNTSVIWEEIDSLVETGELPKEDEKEYTLEELKSIAKERKIKGYTKMTKEELKKALEETVE